MRCSCGCLSFAEAKPFNLPFEEAIRFFRKKLNLTSKNWTEIWQEMHTRAFTVAGAMRDDMLADFKDAIDKALSQGTTIQDFRKSFDTIVHKYGWDYKGERGWRSAVIFDTNLRTAFAAGHYEQMTNPAVLKERPYWQYIGGLSEHPRPLHLEWSGTVLPADDPWWDTHYPPNGWGCKCMVVSVSGPEMERDGLKVNKAPDNGEYEWTNPHTGEIIKVPNGIDPGWAYNPGKVADKLASPVYYGRGQ